MCAGRPTSAMPKPRFLCAPPFGRSVWWWLVVFPWCIGGGDVKDHVMWCGEVYAEMWCSDKWWIVMWWQVTSVEMPSLPRKMLQPYYKLLLLHTTKCYAVPSCDPELITISRSGYLPIFHQIMPLPRKATLNTPTSPYIAPATTWKLTLQHQKLTAQHHQMLRLPRKVTIQHRQILHLPRKVTLQHHQILHLLWNVTLQHPQMLCLPRKMTLQHHQICLAATKNETPTSPIK